MVVLKLGHDARGYTFDAFVQQYGEAGRLLWVGAPLATAAAAAAASQSGFFVTEWRLAYDGQPYSWADFIQHYGVTAGPRFWESAPPASAGAPQPSILSELRRGLDGQPYTWADCVDCYGPSQGSTFWLDAHLLTSAPTLQDDRKANPAQLGGSQQVLPNFAGFWEFASRLFGTRRGAGNDQCFSAWRIAACAARLC